jgi:hypothetical protein
MWTKDPVGIRPSAVPSRPMWLRKGTGMRRGRLRIVGASAALLLLGGLVTGCSGAPQAVIGVPGTYTFGQQVILGPEGPFLGPPGGTVVLCTDTRTALNVATSWSAGISLTFDGVAQYSGGTGYNWTSEPVGPGCGTLGAFASSSAMGSLTSLTVTVTAA